MDIPNINFKDILSKLSVLKNNVSLLISIGIALVAILLFIPTRLMSGKLKAEVTRTSGDMARKVAAANKRPLSRSTPEEMQKNLDVYINDANEVHNLFLQTTQRELLSYEIFPSAPNNASALLFQEFAQHYQKGIDDLILQIKAKDCPTTDELDQGLKSLASDPISRRGSMLSLRPEGGSTSSLARAQGLGLKTRGLTDADYTIVEGICLGRAKECGVYAKAVDISGYTFWNDYKYNIKIDDIVKDCWYYQLGYWIIGDILQTIGSMNTGYDNVLTAPVKRLMSFSFTMGLKKNSLRGGMSMNPLARRKQKKQEGGDKPQYIAVAEDGLTESCTGRYSNDSLDVMHFNFTVVVDAKAVLPFMAELCSAKEHAFNGYLEKLPQPEHYKHNQITILESSVTSIEKESIDHARYRYGDNNVVQLDLICEYVFCKEAYDAIKPEIVKNPPEEENQ